MTPARAIHLVSRHPGALAWMRGQLVCGPFKEHQHLDEGFRVAPGDWVCGVLPLAWVVRLHAQGAVPWVLDVQVPRHLRGQELEPAQLDALGATLVQYHAAELARWPGRR